MSNIAKLLRIYTDESAYFGDRKVFEEVATRARDQRMAGATILQALVGFGQRAHQHRRHVLEDDQSLVIEIIDQEDRLRDFVTTLGDVPGIGLITLEAVEIIGGDAASAIIKRG
jgi:PII-like signaling protein